MNQDGDLEGDIPESLARAILTAAINEERCSEMLMCLFNGGSATVDPVTGKLLLASAKQLQALHVYEVISTATGETVREIVPDDEVVGVTEEYEQCGDRFRGLQCELPRGHDGDHAMTLDGRRDGDG